jgi:hypothetical protein
MGGISFRSLPIRQSGSLTAIKSISYGVNMKPVSPQGGALAKTNTAIAALDEGS